ncbi:hypothetical protein [Kitasatospora sp. LaBMicrA B282]|uniref:hypothetical protein n=1 Tax=Kitasatospora sp. LaBMicrA B282 TaxID=3420949 RepID=UPI003D138478
MAWYQGPCRITVVGVEADWPQRAVVTLRPSGRSIVIAGTVGECQVIEAESWDLAVEHQYGGSWQPNVRAVQSRWEDVRGVGTQLVRSKDQDWSHDRRPTNLVLKVERITPGTPAAIPAVEAATVRRPGVESSPGFRAATWSTPTVRTAAGDGTSSAGTSTPGRVATSGGSAVPGSAASGSAAPGRPATSGSAAQAGRPATAGGEYAL